MPPQKHTIEVNSWPNHPSIYGESADTYYVYLHYFLLAGLLVGSGAVV
jgi:hypothetical protein